MPTSAQGTSSSNTNSEPVTVHDSPNDVSETPSTTDHRQRPVVVPPFDETWNDFDLAFMHDDVFNFKSRGPTPASDDD